MWILLLAFVIGALIGWRVATRFLVPKALENSGARVAFFWFSIIASGFGTVGLFETARIVGHFNLFGRTPHYIGIHITGSTTTCQFYPEVATIDSANESAIWNVIYQGTTSSQVHPSFEVEFDQDPQGNRRSPFDMPAATVPLLGNNSTQSNSSKAKKVTSQRRSDCKNKNDCYFPYHVNAIDATGVKTPCTANPVGSMIGIHITGN